MAVRPLVESGDPVLRQKARKVRDFGPVLQELVDDLVDTMHEAPGLGLAAPQIGVSLRVAVIELPELPEDEEESENPHRGKLYVLCNPEIVKTWGEQEGEEGCLSMPLYMGEVPRAERIVVKAQDQRGKAFRIRGQGLMARVLQHEIDHLDGKLFVDRVESLDKLYRIEPSEDQQPDEEKPVI